MNIFIKRQSLIFCLLLLIFILLVEAGSDEKKKEADEKKRKSYNEKKKEKAATTQEENKKFVEDLNLDHAGTWEADSQIEVSKLREFRKKMLAGIRHHLGFKGFKKDKKGKGKAKVEAKPANLKTRKGIFWKCEDDVEFDAREHWPNCKAIIGRIQAQGICGSCWAISTAAAYSDRYCIKHGQPIHFFAMDILTCMPDPDKMSSTNSADAGSQAGSQHGGSQHGGSQHEGIPSGRKSPGHESPPASGHGSPSRGRSQSVSSNGSKKKSRSASAGPSGTNQGGRSKRSPFGTNQGKEGKSRSPSPGPSGTNQGIVVRGGKKDRSKSPTGSQSSGGGKKDKGKEKAMAAYAEKIAGCGGAEPWDAWNYISEVGICTEECKPLYSFMDRAWLQIKLPKCQAKCTAKNSNKNYQNDKKSCGTPVYWSKYANSLPGKTHAEIAKMMEAQIKAHGPIVASMDVHTDFFFYRKGVYTRTRWAPKVGEHAIRLIGWGTQTCTHSQTGKEEKHKFWLAANTWGVHWGEHGFLKIRRETDECGIESEGITYAPMLTVDQVGVKRTRTE